MKRNHQIVASWVFGSIFSAFLMVAFFVDGGSRTHDPIVRWTAAISAGLLGFFLTGSMRFVSEGHWKELGKVTIQAGGAAAFFVLVWVTWPKPDANPAKIIKVVNKG